MLSPKIDAAERFLVRRRLWVLGNTATHLTLKDFIFSSDTDQLVRHHPHEAVRSRPYVI
jgi:hypothetical protein